MAFIPPSPLPFLPSLILLSLAPTRCLAVQPRAPHGLQFESPMPFPPSAFDFFHPNSHPVGTGPPLVQPLLTDPSSSKVRADRMQESVWLAPRSHGGGVGVAAVVLGLVFVVLMAACGVSYVVLKRRANTKRACTVIQPDA